MILLQRFFEICLLKASPADVPASSWLMKLSLIVYLMISTIVTHVDHPWFISLTASLADVVVMMVACWLLLSWHGLKQRYLQTITAMAGVSSILNIVVLPVVLLYRQFEDQGQITSLILLLLMIALFWSLMVVAHIFRKALDISAGKAAIITVLYTLVSFFLVGLVMSEVVGRG